MRKHHTRWVALFSAAAISTTGLVGLAGPATADDKDTRAFSWPVVRQGVSSFSVDGFEIAYLPAGLERYSINATSTTDRQGARQSQLSWMQGPDQLYARVVVLRSERLQDLDDLREERYSHLSESSLEELEAGESFEHGAYLSEETGDLFWVEEPGVAVSTHLQPDRWESSELLRMAEAVTETGGETGAGEVQSEEAPAEEPPAETEKAEEAESEEGAAEETDQAEAPVKEAPAEEAPAEEAPAEEAPVEEAPVEEAPVEDVVDEAAAEEPADLVEEAPVEEAPAEEAAAEEAPVEEAPAENVVDEEVVDGAEVDEVAPAEEPQEEAVPPGEADLPDDVTSHEVKACLTEHFVDFAAGETDLDEAQMTRASGEFVEKALSRNDLDDGERDRLLATVWYYGNENAKVAATNDCAQQFELERGVVEDVLSQVSGLIGQLVQEADEGTSETTDATEATEATDGAEKVSSGTDEVTDPVGAAEWAELWDSLPWSIPAGTP